MLLSFYWPNLLQYVFLALCPKMALKKLLQVFYVFLGLWTGPTWTAPVFLGNWRVKLWSDPTYHTSFFRYDVTLKESTHTDHIYGLHAPNMLTKGISPIEGNFRISWFQGVGDLYLLCHMHIYMFIHRNTLPRLGFYHAPRAYCTITSLYHSN